MTELSDHQPDRPADQPIDFEHHIAVARTERNAAIAAAFANLVAAVRSALAAQPAQLAQGRH